jgi:hypothetical protein
MSLLGAAGVWLASSGVVPIPLVALLGVLTVWAFLPAGRARSVAVIACVVLQGTTLFLESKQKHLRPAAQPEVFRAHDDTLAELRRRIGDDRVHIVGDALLEPSLMQKAGTLHRLRVIGGYQPLASLRAAEYFERIEPPSNPLAPFQGGIALLPRSIWAMMDLAAVRWYVVSPGSATDGFLAARVRQTGSTRVRLVRDGMPRLYERRAALTRARFASEARFFDEPGPVLDTLGSLRSAPRSEVLLERIEGVTPVGYPPHLGGVETAAEVAILVDDPERVELEVDTTRHGWVVLADAWHTGWRASIDAAEVPIWRANYLFRAVQVGPGKSRIVFTYHSRPLQTGLVVSGLALVVLGALAFHCRRSDEPVPQA